MKNKNKPSAFTLIELLVVISIIAILASIALPVFASVQTRGQQTKALANAKQIGLALKMYAMDNNGSFPSYTLDANLKPTNVQVSDANTAFSELFPDYLQSEQIFYVPRSAYTLNPPDNKIDNPQLFPPVDTLKQGENEWAYVTGLGDTSNSLYPLIADGFQPNTTTYTTDVTKPGGVWQGARAVVILCDFSGAIMKCKITGNTSQIPGSPNSTNLFATDGGTTQQPWLAAPGNVVVTPK